MTSVIARIKIKGKKFEILVDLDRALEFKKEGGNVREVVEVDRIFSDHNKGMASSEDDLKNAFGTNDFEKICEKIIKSGEIQLPTEYKNKELEDRKKQIIEFLVKNTTDQNGNAFTRERIGSALDEAGVRIENKPVHEQISRIIKEIKKAIQIKLETKKLKIVIPAAQTGQVYGLVNEYKEKETWKDNGDLEVVINLPVGLQMDFYDRLNSVTHGSAVVEEVKEQ